MKSKDIKVINSKLAYMDGGIESNPYETTRAYLLAYAQGKLLQHLPYAVRVFPYMSAIDPEEQPNRYNLECWYDVWSIAAKGCRDIDTYRDEILQFDFTQKYDNDIAKIIIKKYESTPKKSEIEVDAVEIAEAENENI